MSQKEKCEKNIYKNKKIMKLIRRIFSFLKLIVGFRYKVNLNSMEIHDLKNPKQNCLTEVIADYKQIGKKSLSRYLSSGYNGCRWCMKLEDKG